MNMTIDALRLRIRTFERGSIATEPLAAMVADVVPVQAPEFDEDGRLFVFRFSRRQPERVVIDRDRIFEYVGRRRPTIDGRPVRLLPDMGVRSYLRDLKNRADFYTGVRELQTHADVVALAPRIKIRP